MNAVQDQPLIIIGAGRSGTSMIREALVQHRDVAGYQFEMNYLWRFGNANLEHDLLLPEVHLNDAIAEHIRAAFVGEGARQGKSRVLDKTVANVMRPRFVQAVLPEARILHVVRDGRAVAASAMKRWAAPQPAGYFAAKARTIPLRSLPSVAARYLGRSFRTRLRRRDYRQSWGPRWPGIDEAVRDLPLAQVCGRQWTESVSAALRQKDDLNPETYMEVRYEELVNDPAGQFERLRAFFQLADDSSFRAWVSSRVDAGRCRRWQTDLNPEDLHLIEVEQLPLLRELGYL